MVLRQTLTVTQHIGSPGEASAATVVCGAIEEGHCGFAVSRAAGRSSMNTDGAELNPHQMCHRLFMCLILFSTSVQKLPASVMGGN